MGRRIITTENGLLGCVGEDTRPGDWLCSLQGCDMDVVIRAQGPRFRVMGEWTILRLGGSGGWQRVRGGRSRILYYARFPGRRAEGEE